MDTKGKVALVTGVSRGMGKQMALRLARHGVNIVGVARTVEPSESEWPGTLKQAEREIRELGVNVLPVKCDLMVRSDVENLCKTASTDSAALTSWSTMHATSDRSCSIRFWSSKSIPGKSICAWTCWRR